MVAGQKSGDKKGRLEEGNLSRYALQTKFNFSANLDAFCCCKFVC